MNQKLLSYRLSSFFILRQAKHQAKDQEADEYTLSGMCDDAIPGTAEAFGRIGKEEYTGDGYHTPRLVDMVKPKQDTIGQPVPPAKHFIHPWQQQSTEQQLLSQEGIEHR